MKRSLQGVLLVALTGLLLTGITNRVNAAGPLGPIFRFSAETQFDGELATASGPPGLLVYSKTFFNPFPTLFVTIAATGDTHGGMTLILECLVNGVPCNPGDSGASTAPGGWVPMIHLPDGGSDASCNNGGGGPGDCHDNNFNYTWCSNVTPGPATVQLRLASWNQAAGTGGSDFVFYERAHIFIDATPNPKADNRCVPATIAGG